mgnify:CR=1 FL=1
MAGLYFHIPFCKRICAYCDFYKSARLEQMDGVTAAMHRELDERQDYLRGEAVTTRYFGGGTPSLYAPAALKGLLDHAALLFDCSGTTETTLEANPDDLTENYLDGLREAGIDRLSIGIQSFDDGCLKLMNRRHTADAARKAVRQAQEAGFGNVTVDLIFGVPGFGAATLARNLRETVALGVQHVSAYHLTVEPQTAFGRRMAQGRFSPVTEETSEEEFLTVHRTLRDAGFEHYEVSNYALPGRRAIHNSAYWSGDPYLGIGPAAHSFDGECRRWAVADIGRYLAGGDRYESERLTERDRYNETVMTALRTAEGLDTKAIGRRFGPARLETLLDAARPWLDAGDATLRDGQLAIPAERFLLSDAVIAALFWEC